MIVYVAGPMSGYEQFNRPAFHSAAKRLTDKGYVVLNPATLPDGLTQAQYMDICLAMLRCADTIYMLKEWEYSAGARAENALAEKLVLNVLLKSGIQMAYERESLIEKHLVAEVKKAGGVAFKFISPGRRSVPDRIVLLPGGRIVFVECKAPGKPPRAGQLREHGRLRALGFTVVVLDSKNLEGILCGSLLQRNRP